MSDRETPAPGERDGAAGDGRGPVGEGSTANGRADEATRITRIVLMAVIFILVGGLALLLVFGPGDDDSARDAVGDLGRSQVSIREAGGESTTTTADTVTTETAAPAETAPPATDAAVPPPTPGPPAPPPPPGQPATTAAPPRLEVFFGTDSQGRLPVKVGQATQISIRNTGGSEGAWALNATGAVRIDGVTGKNGRVPGGSVTVVTVTVDPASAPSVPTEATIRFDTSDGESRDILVQISP